MTQLQQLAARATDSFSEILLYYLVTIAGSGILFSYLEDKPFFESLWWACVTGLTIGYGDLYPVTVGGKCGPEVPQQYLQDSESPESIKLRPVHHLACVLGRIL